MFFRGHKADLPKKLLGFGKPLYANLVFSDENAVTFIIESQIGLEELETIKIVLPEFINRSGNKLNFNATLCFNFLPIKDNHLNYLPLQITFGIFKPQDASTISGSNSESYKIKPAISWSEDFFGIENRLLSNVQRIDFNLSGVDIERLHNEVTLAVKCTGKKEIPTIHREPLENNQHKFSLILTIIETPTSRVSNRLYNDITAVNTIKAIAEAEGEAFAEIE